MNLMVVILFNEISLLLLPGQHPSLNVILSISNGSDGSKKLAVLLIVTCTCRSQSHRKERMLY